MRLQIIGAPGTGKSALAKYISEQRNIKWIEAEHYQWQDQARKQENSLDVRMALYEKDIAENKAYVVSGSVFSWCQSGFTNRDVLIFLYLDEDIRMQRLREREIQRMGEQHMWLGDDRLYTNEFLENCKTYKTQTDINVADSYAEHQHQLEISKSPVLRLNSDRPLEVLYLKILKVFSH